MGLFSECSAYLDLQKLAQNPIDLSQEGVINSSRIEKFQQESIGIRLVYPFEKLTDEVVLSLQDLAHQRDAVKKMQQMQSGEVMNQIHGFPSENRQVLHTAVRDFFDAPQSAKQAKEATVQAEQEIEKLRKFERLINQTQSFDTVIQIGIGGSDLGPRAIYLALQNFQVAKRKVFFISNVDPDDAAAVFEQIDLKKTLFIVVSKSGTTLETETNEAFFRKEYEKLNLNSQEHFVAVTGKGSPMDNPKIYRESFYIWDYIGGRYSVTSMVGGVVLTLGLGFSLYMEFLKGASAMDKVALKEDIKENLPLMGALIGIWNHNFLKAPTLAVIPYAQALSRFPAHLQQLDMESNGKGIDQDGRFCSFQTGPIIWGEPGTNGQHSFYQLIHQGTQIVPVCFIGFKNNQKGVDWEFEKSCSQDKLKANLFAQSLALAIGQKSTNPNQVFLGNRPSHLLLADRLTPYILGGLLAYFEHKVAFQGFIWGINSFDQEGVQLGKKLAKEFLRIMHPEQPLSQSDFPIGQALLNLWSD